MAGGLEGLLQGTQDVKIRRINFVAAQHSDEALIPTDINIIALNEPSQVGILDNFVVAIVGYSNS